MPPPHLPPPEKPEAIRARRNVILSFWVVILLLGVPIWWWTTAIPRAALPLYDMLQWESTRPAYVVNVRIAATDLTCEQLQQTLLSTQSLLDERNEFSAFQIRLRPVQFSTPASGGASSSTNAAGCPALNLDDGMLTVDIALETGPEFLLDLSGGTAMGKITYRSAEVDGLPQYLTETLEKIFMEEKATVAYQYITHGESSSALQTYIRSLPHDIVTAVERNAARAFKASPGYHLTFSLFTAGGTPSSWDIQPILDQYLLPLVHSMSKSANFSITTQVQMYSAMSPSIQPFSREDEEGVFLSKDDLTAFINTAEWPLSPSIGSGPTINFILYVPPKHQIPLQIDGSNAQSWLIPQWGSIRILNPPLFMKEDTNAMTVISHLDEQILAPAFGEFQSQLLALLGVSSSTSLPLALRLKSFQRLSGLALYLRATSNLGSLARLAQRLANIPIPHHVAELVELTSTSLRQFRETRDLLAARTAFDASEKAFFDKSMVGQVYFPDEHKVAVYLPLLGPIGVPLIVGLLREIKLMAFKK